MALIVFLIASILASHCHCDLLKSNTEPYKLSTLAARDLYLLQLQQLKYKEPIISYDKLVSGKLEILGSAFEGGIEYEDITFIKRICDFFYIQELSFRFILFSPSFQDTFDIFRRLFVTTVKELTFERCYFPCSFHSNVGQKFNINSLKIINCICTNSSLNELFKLSNENLVSLHVNVMSSLFANIISNRQLEFVEHYRFSADSISINFHIVSNYFPNLKRLILRNVTLTEDFALNMFQSLEFADFEENTFYMKHMDAEKALPQTLQKIKTIYPKQFIYALDTYRFVENGVVLECKDPVEINYYLTYLKVLFAFNYFHIDLISMCEESYLSLITFISAFDLQLNNVQKLSIVIDLSLKLTERLLQLVQNFLSLSCLEVRIIYSCFENTTKLFAGRTLKNITVLDISLMYDNSKEQQEQQEEIDEEQVKTCTASFIFEMLKLCPATKTLTFFYGCSNSFVKKLNQMTRSLQLAALETIHYNYFSENPISIADDLTFIAKYNVKSMKITVSRCQFFWIDNETDFDKIPQLSFKRLGLTMPVVTRDKYSLLNRVFDKMPGLQTIDFLQIPYEAAVDMNWNRFVHLQNLTLAIECVSYEYIRLFGLLPARLLEVSICFHFCDMHIIKEPFRKTLPKTKLSFFYCS